MRTLILLNLSVPSSSFTSAYVNKVMKIDSEIKKRVVMYVGGKLEEGGERSMRNVVELGRVSEEVRIFRQFFKTFFGATLT